MYSPLIKFLTLGEMVKLRNKDKDQMMGHYLPVVLASSVS